jgi:hypothetical protein
LQEGGSEEKQEKGVWHQKMLRIIDREESEDAGQRRATGSRGNFGLLEKSGLEEG